MLSDRHFFSLMFKGILTWSVIGWGLEVLIEGLVGPLAFSGEGTTVEKRLASSH